MRTLLSVLATGMTILALLFGLAPVSSQAASHREAPLISMDPTADITDFFMFRSYEPGREDKIVLIMDVIPGEEPSAGPNYYNFDPTVLYAINIDNNMDGKADDVRFEFEFKTQLRGIIKQLDLFLGFVALPPITTLDGPGSEGLGLRQTYTVTMVRGDQRKVLARNLIAVPSNVGPRTMPDYESLAQQGIYDLDDGARVFAGQRDDPFYIDLGAVFDTLNVGGPGVDMLSGFNVHSIALEVPASWLTEDEQDVEDTSSPVLGGYASTYRRSMTVLRDRTGDEGAEGNLRETSGDWVQVQRLANPLVNEVIIGTEDKDRWNANDPSRERRFVKYYNQPRLATALEAVFGMDATPLEDLRDVFLTYVPGRYGRLSELLRLDISVPPTPLESQNRLTLLGTPGDLAGWPNGRRPIDDVTDIALQVVGGPNYTGAGDNVDANDLPLPNAFPFLPTPWDGLNHIHQNPPGGPPITLTPMSPTPVLTFTPPTPTPFRTFTPTGTIFVPTFTPTLTPFVPSATPTGTFLPPTVPSRTGTPTGTITITPSITSTLTATPTPVGLLPDLTIGFLRIELQHPSCFLPGDPLGIRVGIANNGSAAAGAFVVNVNGATQTVNGLGAGQTTAVFFPSFSNPVTATVDSTNTVAESNESNNTRSEMVPVPTAPLPCTPTPTP